MKLLYYIFFLSALILQASCGDDANKNSQTADNSDFCQSGSGLIFYNRYSVDIDGETFFLNLNVINNSASAYDNLGNKLHCKFLNTDEFFVDSGSGIEFSGHFCGDSAVGSLKSGKRVVFKPDYTNANFLKTVCFISEDSSLKYSAVCITSNRLPAGVKTLLADFYFGKKSIDLQTGFKNTVAGYKADISRKSGESRTVLSLSCDVVYNNERFFVIKKTLCQDSGALAPVDKSDFICIDVVSAKRITVDDLFDSQAREKIKELITEDLKRHEDPTANIFYDEVTVTNNFTFTGSGITFEYNSYEISDSEHAECVVKIDTADLKSLMNPFYFNIISQQYKLNK